MCFNVLLFDPGIWIFSRVYRGCYVLLERISDFLFNSFRRENIVIILFFIVNNIFKTLPVGIFRRSRFGIALRTSSYLKL